MTVPTVSVCMITWNHRRYIRQAMESVLNQEAPFHVELIVGDDHSTDGTSDVVDNIARENPDRVVVVRGKENLGMHENASRCFQAARGKYIAICEGDDYWHDIHKLRDQVILLENDPSMTLCHSDFDRLTRLRRRRDCHRSGLVEPPQGDAYESLLKAWGIMSATAVYRTSLLRAFQGTKLDERRWPFGDYNRLLYAAANGTVGYLARSTATYRKIRGSAGNQGAAGALRIQIANRECIEAFMACYPPTVEGRAQALESAWLRIRRAGFWAGRPDTMAEANASLLRLGAPRRTSWPIRSRLASSKHAIAVIRAIRDWLDGHLSALPR